MLRAKNTYLLKFKLLSLRTVSFHFRYILEYQKGDLMNMDTEKLVEYNPTLAKISPTARIAYAKFKMNLIRKEYDGYQNVSRDPSLKRGSSIRHSVKRQSSTTNASLDTRRKLSLKDITEIEIDKEHEPQQGE